MKAKGLYIKVFGTFLAIVVLVVSVVFCIKQPKMHNQFQISVIEYLLKINSDGSTTVTKEITTTKLQEKQ